MTLGTSQEGKALSLQWWQRRAGGGWKNDQERAAGGPEGSQCGLISEKGPKKVGGLLKTVLLVFFACFGFEAKR